MRKIDFLGVHCSASDIPSHDNIETIRKWHVTENGWSDIGYHYLITKDGKLHLGRPLHIPGAHIRGHNARSIGICLSGNREFTREQFVTLEKLCRELCEKFGLSKLNILGHNRLEKNKTCPNFDLQALLTSWGWD